MDFDAKLVQFGSLHVFIQVQSRALGVTGALGLIAGG